MTRTVIIERQSDLPEELTLMPGDGWPGATPTPNFKSVADAEGAAIQMLVDNSGLRAVAVVEVRKWVMREPVEATNG